MISRQLAIGLAVGISIGLSVMAIIGQLRPKPETTIYDVSTKRLKERVKSDSVLIDNLKKNVRVEIREIEKIKIKYVPVQNEINRGNPVQLDSMFNVILSE